MKQIKQILFACFASKRIRGFYMRNEYLDAVHFDGLAHHDCDGLPVGDDPVVILSAGRMR
jgi:hypothetical protein